MARCRSLIVALLAVWLLVPVGMVSAYAVDQAAIEAKRPPKYLSAFGFFSDLTAQTPGEGVLPFVINTPLFSDHALKFRFVHVPDGLSARYDETEAFAFPEGSALIKTFAYPGGHSGPKGNLKLIETRLLLKSARGWRAWAYLWNDEQTDAELNIVGAKLAIDTQLEDGTSLDFTYSVPNKNQCKGCHAINGEIVPIGPKARNLNGVFAYPDGLQNQLSRWTDARLLVDAPAPELAPAAPDWTDNDADLNLRARAWLDVNCAHCHRRNGPASNTGLFLTWDEDDPVALGIGKRPVAAGRGSGGRLFDIKPGDPDGSILFFRVQSTEPGIMMPELGRSLPDDDATRLLREWIATMR